MMLKRRLQIMQPSSKKKRFDNMYLLDSAKPLPKARTMSIYHEYHWREPLQDKFQEREKFISNHTSQSNCTSTTNFVHRPREWFPLKQRKCFIPSYFILLIIIVNIFNYYKVQCLTTTKDFYPTQCDFKLGTDYELIEPMIVKENVSKNNTSIFDYTDSMSSVPLAAGISTTCPNILRIYFDGYGERYVIDLVKNKRLISDRYFKISKENVNRHGRHPDITKKGLTETADSEFYKNHEFLDLHNFTSNDDHCHYHGFVNANMGSISGISIVNHRLLSGFFHDGNDIYFLHANMTNSTTLLTKNEEICTTKTNFQVKPSRTRRDTDHHFGSSSDADNYIIHDPFSANSSSLYVELLVVHDHSQYVEYKGNTTSIAERTMQIVNIMNAFYRQLNIFITLVGVVVWLEKDEIQLTEDGDATLTNFLKYRFEKLLPKYHHDNAQLITSTSFNGSVVGKALKGPICTHEHSGGVNTAHSHNPAIVAVTLAHELGHNFGMEHDEEETCKCPDEKCIMSSSSSLVHPKRWSTCSVEYLEESKKQGLLDCLQNRPEKIFGPFCGNGFIEEGEDCDIGEPVPTFGTSKSRKTEGKCIPGQDCDVSNVKPNPCCDRKTCKFVTNATCAQGPCCDLSSCSVYNSLSEIKVCRPRQSECDLEEVCDGKSEFCPQDVYYHDGLQCGPTISMSENGLFQEHELGSLASNRSRAYCFNGKCASHESQCQLLWGPTGSVSKDICYEQNIHGNTSGHCGFNRRDKTYDSCLQGDAICGMLHCVHNQPPANDSRKTGKLHYGFESASILTVSFFVMSNRAKLYCNGAIIDAGSDARDPGLVPNGAACGDDKMCLNQKCVPVYDVVYKNWCSSDCNGNGICDNLGVCHCFDGTIGTSCYQFFGSNFHLSILLYMIMFFVPLTALMVFTINHFRGRIKIWWFLHQRKTALRDKQRDLQNQRKSGHEPGGINRLTVTISSPIPLNQHNNINRPFYEPSIDPWNDTANQQQCQTGKSIGFRLEPLKKQVTNTSNLTSSDLTTRSTITTDNQNSSSSFRVQQVENLKPVRAAPPPPIPEQQPKV